MMTAPGRNRSKPGCPVPEKRSDMPVDSRSNPTSLGNPAPMRTMVMLTNASIEGVILDEDEDGFC